MTQKKEYWVKVLRWETVRIWAEDADHAKDLAAEPGLIPGVLQVAEERPRQVPKWQADGETAKHGPFSAAAAEELYNRIDGEIGGGK